MITAAAETTWGPKLITPPSVDLSQTRGAKEGIKGELHAFLKEEIDEWQPQLVIVVERRGTAILRALKECPDFPINVPWDRIISSRVLDQLPSSYFSNKRILIFDDLKQHGSQVSRVLTTLKTLNENADLKKWIRVAVFGMHEDATSHSALQQFEVSESWRYRGLTTSAYRKMRLEIITMLQECGSLMLDTEHIEVRMRLKGTFPALLEALARKATVIPFHSLGSRQNITILYADNDPAHVVPLSRLPTGTQTSGIVKKCRIVERGSDEFAIIPICYPIVFDSGETWPADEADAALLGASVHTESSRAQFYGTALFSALTILEWTLKSLYAGDQDLAAIYLPSANNNPNRSARGYGLDHLHVMYPTLDLPRLTVEIGKAASRAEHDGRQLRRRPIQQAPALEISDAELRQNAWELIQVIRRELDNRAQEELLIDPEWKPRHPFGLTAEEIFKLASRFGWPKVQASALFDILIDDGHLVTEVASQVDDAGQQRSVRVFYPDGEMVSELIRLYTNQRGLPNGF